MKRCPECRRDYYDESLMYCLDDGAALLDGPGSQDDTATAILADSAGSEAPTRNQPQRNRESSTTPLTAQASGVSPRAKLLGALILVLVIIVAGAFLAYRYMGNRDRPIQSIAVLPFRNESGNPDVEYLSDGMMESLINSLSALPNLSVKARSSVFQYKGTETTPQKIGSDLSVQAVLNGRVVQHGDDLVLYLSLVDTNSGNQIWGDEYDRKLTDILLLEREVTRDVLNKLRLRLTPADERILTKNTTVSPEAYQLYLRGRFHVLKVTAAEIQTGISYYQQAIQIDPNFALAYVGIADGYRSLAIGAEMEPGEFMPKAKAAALKAIDIDDGLAEGHAVLGFIIFWYDWDWNAAERQFKRALELDPNSAEAHLAYAHLLSNIGRSDEALAEAKKAIDLDPQNLRTAVLEGQFLMHGGKLDEAIDKLRKVADSDPSYWFPHSFLASAYIEKGMLPEAIAEGRKATQLSPNQTIGPTFEAFALAKSGDQAEARARLALLIDLSAKRFVPPYHIALVYCGLRQNDDALQWLQRGYEARDPKMVFLKIEPKWAGLRSDPRFQELIKRMNFPD
ncbi:MAG: tetratricopeptide repeat protein [Pyrinomonadaceae bacterium]